MKRFHVILIYMSYLSLLGKIQKNDINQNYSTFEKKCDLKSYKFNHDNKIFISKLHICIEIYRPYKKILTYYVLLIYIPRCVKKFFKIHNRKLDVSKHHSDILRKICILSDVKTK